MDFSAPFCGRIGTSVVVHGLHQEGVFRGECASQKRCVGASFYGGAEVGGHGVTPREPDVTPHNHVPARHTQTHVTWNHTPRATR